MVGISYSDFWKMTLDEINDCIKSYIEQKKSEYQIDTQLTYQTAVLTAGFVNRLFHGEQIPSFYDVFPMYDTNQQNDRKQIEIIRDNWIVYAQNYNKRQKK